MARTRPIPSTHGEYLAGEDGSIWRRGHWVPGRGWAPPRRIAQGLQGSRGRAARRGRYLKVNVSVNGHEVQRAVHRLVAEAWLDGWHPLYEVHHVNGDPMDNRPANLALVNRADHEALHGMDVREVDRVNCQIDLERRMAEYEWADPFSGRPPKRGKPGRGSQRNSIAQIAAQAERLGEEIARSERRRKKRCRDR